MNEKPNRVEELKSNLKQSRTKRMMSRKRKLLLQNIIIIAFVVIVITIMIIVQINPDFFDFMGKNKNVNIEQVTP